MTKQLHRFFATNNGFATADRTSLVIAPLSMIRHVYMKAVSLTAEQATNASWSAYEAVLVSLRDDKDRGKANIPVWAIRMNKGGVADCTPTYFYGKFFRTVDEANDMMLALMEEYNSNPNSET